METIETINIRLIDRFGIDTVTGMPIWRVSWSDDQREWRKMDCTPGGIQLLYPQVFDVPKYPYICERYVLERLVVVPEINLDEIPNNKLSYEPMWVFQQADGSYIPPIFSAVEFIIDTVHAAMRQDGGLRKYTEDELHTTPEGREKRIDTLEEELFGDESGLKGKTHLTGEGIIVPKNYEKES